VHLFFAPEQRFFSDGAPFSSGPQKKIKIPRDFFVQAQEKKL